MDGELQGTVDANLTHGSVGGGLLKLAVPMTWGVFAIVAFQLADTYYVGRLPGTDPLAAISFTFPVVTIIHSIAIALGVGAGSVISRAIGHGDRRQVQRLTTDSLTLAMLVVGIFILVGILTIDPLFTAIGSDEKTLPLIRDYMQIWYFGMIFLVVPMVGNNAIRASGNAVYPALIMTISAGINILLDPILIFGLYGFPRMELAGAAAATVFARAISLLAAIGILHFKKRMLSFSVPKISEVLISWKRILHIGVPAAGMFAIVPLSGFIITRMIAGFGIHAVAAFGVASRIESFSFIVLFALSTSITPFVGQNFGAGKHGRVRKGLKLAFMFCIGWGLFAAVILGLFGRFFSSLFDEQPEVIETAGMYFLIIPISYGLQGLTLIVSATFNAMGKPLPATVITFVRAIGLYIPLAWCMKQFLDTNGIFIAACVSNIIVGVWAFLWNRKILRGQT